MCLCGRQVVCKEKGNYGIILSRYSMRKFLIALTVCAVMLCGCRKQSQEDKYSINYEAYCRTLTEATKFVPLSRYYSVSGAMSQMPDGTYRYYVFVDNPRIAMTDIVVLAVESGTEYAAGSKMMPSSGIFGDAYSMIPYQINKENGYVKGIMLNGECSDDHVLLHVLVEWKDRSRKNARREFIELSLNYEDDPYQPDDEESSEDTESEED